LESLTNNQYNDISVSSNQKLLIKNQFFCKERNGRIIEKRKISIFKRLLLHLFKIPYFFNIMKSQYIFFHGILDLDARKNIEAFFWSCYSGSRCYVRLDVLRQFKTDLVRQLEGLVFEEKKFLT
jgi:hypothetical protein